ncbi:uncharacterized protein KY384_004146 [Bacidia gigantensis]|uniref:uncharacterized protein n=1 Tax=Bacidia gigantensis TaxID=2732470 RepID=UPI001D0433EB|nr:uncharacterized protein KY384_004146 [Bacidia gigantensis]KAG8530789.1 hypothetical protein KY384_004146 [Bacidia gigantensis]
MPIIKLSPNPRDSTYIAQAFSNLYHHLPDASIDQLLDFPPVYPDGPDTPTLWRRNHGWLDELSAAQYPPEKRRMRAWREVMVELIGLGCGACDGESDEEDEGFGTGKGETLKGEVSGRSLEVIPWDGDADEFVRSPVQGGHVGRIGVVRKAMVMQKMVGQYRHCKDGHVARRDERRRREHQVAMNVLRRHAAFMRVTVAA